MTIGEFFVQLREKDIVNAYGGPYSSDTSYTYNTTDYCKELINRVCSTYWGHFATIEPNRLVIWVPDIMKAHRSEYWHYARIPLPAGAETPMDHIRSCAEYPEIAMLFGILQCTDLLEQTDDMGTDPEELVF